MRLLVGLGNPGRRYEGTRHNVGFDVVDLVLESSGGRWSEATSDAVQADVELEGCRVTLVKPLTYMNLSGGPVARLAEERGLERNEVLIYIDDVALPLGALRLRERGSDGGHNGLASVLEALGGQDVPRMRIGVGSDESGEGLVDFVLTPFAADERRVIDETLERAVEATRAILTDGMAKAMSRFNRTPEAPCES